MMRSLFLLGALLAALPASAQMPDGLIGRWRAADGDDIVLDAGRVTEVTFRADSTGEIRVASRAAFPYAVTTALARQGDALAGAFLGSLGGRVAEFVVSLEEPRLGLTIRAEQTVLDLDRVSGVPGSLAGTWAVRSLTSGVRGEAPRGGPRLNAFTFTADSLRIEMTSAFAYRADSESVRIGTDPATLLLEDPMALLLDGDALAIKLTNTPGFARFVRAADEVPDTATVTPFLGRWVPVDGATGAERAAEAMTSMTFAPDGRVTTVTRSRMTVAVDGAHITFSRGPEEMVERYALSLASDTLTLRRSDEAFTFARVSGTPGRLAGRWEHVGTAGSAGVMARSGVTFRAITFDAGGATDVETATEGAFSVVDRRLSLESPPGMSVRFRYRFDGDTLTLSRPFDPAAAHLRRAD